MRSHPVVPDIYIYACVSIQNCNLYVHAANNLKK